MGRPEKSKHDCMINIILNWRDTKNPHGAQREMAWKASLGRFFSVNHPERGLVNVIISERERFLWNQDVICHCGVLLICWERELDEFTGILPILQVPLRGPYTRRAVIINRLSHPTVHFSKHALLSLGFCATLQSGGSGRDTEKCPQWVCPGAQERESWGFLNP